MPKINDLREERAKKIARAKEILKRADDAATGLTSDEKKNYDDLLAEIEDLKNRIEELSKIDSMRATLDEMQEGVDEDDPRHPVRSAYLPHQDPRNTRNGRYQYSVMDAIRSQMPGGKPLQGLEREVHHELAKSRRTGAKGVMIPWDLPVSVRRSALSKAEYRLLSTTVGSGGIPTILATEMIDLLRARLVLSQLGVTVLNDMRGLFAIPAQTAAAVGSWEPEGTAPAGSNQTIGQVPFSPKSAVCYTDISRRLIEELSSDAENLVRRDLVAVIARMIEYAAINGTGASNNQPLGILQNPAITQTVAIATNGGLPDWSNIVDMESLVAEANADVGKLGYLTNAAVRGTLKQTLKIASSSFPVFIWDTSDKETPLNQYPVAVTNQVPNNLTKGTGTNLSAIIYGNWEDLAIAFWSGIDLLVDPYSNSSSGTIRIVAIQDADVNVRHPQSFSTIVDCQTM